MTTHRYETHLAWQGSTGDGYRSYSRDHRASTPPDGPEVALSADRAFRGTPGVLNPEQLVVMAASSCQLLSFLGLAAREGVDVLGYVDEATGEMPETSSPVRLTTIHLTPVVQVAPGTDVALVESLVHRAHEQCYVASSLLTEVLVTPTIEVVTGEQDVEVALVDRPDALAELGRVLGAAGVSLLGGGMFRHEGTGVAHFLVADGAAATHALEAAGLRVVAVSDVVTLRLRQGVPGQLGLLLGLMAEAGVVVRAQYSDHDHRLVLVVDPAHLAEAREVAAAW